MVSCAQLLLLLHKQLESTVLYCTVRNDHTTLTSLALQPFILVSELINATTSLQESSVRCIHIPCAVLLHTLSIVQPS